MTVTCQAPAGQLPVTCQASSVECLFSSRFGALGPHSVLLFPLISGIISIPSSVRLEPLSPFPVGGAFLCHVTKSSVQQVASRRNHSATFGMAFSKVVGSGPMVRMFSRYSTISPRLSDFLGRCKSLECDFVRSCFGFYNHSSRPIKP